MEIVKNAHLGITLEIEFVCLLMTNAKLGINWMERALIATLAILFPIQIVLLIK